MVRFTSWVPVLMMFTVFDVVLATKSRLPSGDSTMGRDWGLVKVSWPTGMEGVGPAHLMPMERLPTSRVTAARA